MNWVFIGLLTALTAAAQTPAEMAQNLNTQGNRAAESGNYPEAERLYQESIGIWRSLGAPYEARTASALLNLGAAMGSEGQRAAAAKVMEEALAMHRHSLGARNLRTVTNMNLLANNDLMGGNVERAEELYGEALLIERELYPGDQQTALTLDGIVYCLLRRRRGGESLPLAEEALHIAIQSTGEDSLETAYAYASVAEAHRAMGSGARALPLYRKARALYQNVLGPTHPRVAAILSQEGLILMQDGKLALAQQSMTQALMSLRTESAACPGELAMAETNLGLLRLRQKHYRDAAEAFSAAIEVREKLTAGPDPDLADALQGLAKVREKEHRLDEAARLNSRAETIRGYR
jgi:tetratricopeptide (TPR) repeat protein